ncbi:hypothetical protein Tco_0624718, partial [Tanacetum coccineum]
VVGDYLIKLWEWMKRGEEWSTHQAHAVVVRGRSLDDKKRYACSRQEIQNRSSEHGSNETNASRSTKDYDSSSPVSATGEEGAPEALNMSFGVGNYARRMLENLGWKEEYCIRHVDGSHVKSEAERQRTVQHIETAIERRISEVRPVYQLG